MVRSTRKISGQPKQLGQNNRLKLEQASATQQPIVPLNTELHAHLLQSGAACPSSYESAMVALENLRKLKRESGC